MPDRKLNGPLALTFAHAAALAFLLAVPDLMLGWQGLAPYPWARPKGLIIVALVALLAVLMPQRRARLLGLAFLVVNQLIWVGTAVYYGRALGPEQLLLLRYEVSDTLSGALAEWRSLAPVLAAVVAAGAAGLGLLWPDRRGRLATTALALPLAMMALIGGAAFWSMHRRIEVSFPGVHTPSIYGPYQAVVAAFRIASTHAMGAEAGDVQDQVVVAHPLEEEPVTVIVIMGESINPYRMSLFSGPRETTPALTSWLTAPPAGFAFMARYGISGGTATFGSVPSFLRMAFSPIEAQTRGVNLFDLASRGGFRSWYLSVQSKQFLEAAGGAPDAVRIETDRGGDNEVRLALRHDDALVDLVSEVPDQEPRRFVFLHQRVNHAGYKSHCTHAPQGMYPFDDSHGSTADMRRAAYDNGLRCWDRNVSALAKRFLDARGAVYIFMMSDHSELMGEQGLWGHGFPDLHASLVPMMLLTNRPASAVARKFEALDPPTSYRMAQTVALALGFAVETPGISPQRTYLNNTMPFGLAGFMEVERLGATRFRVATFARSGERLDARTLDLPELGLRKSSRPAGWDGTPRLAAPMTHIR